MADSLLQGSTYIDGHGYVGHLSRPQQERIKHFTQKFQSLSSECDSIRRSSEKYNRIADRFRRRSKVMVNGNSKSFTRMQNRVERLKNINLGINTKMEKDTDFDSMVKEFYVASKMI